MEDKKIANKVIELFLAKQNSLEASFHLNDSTNHPSEKGESTECEWSSWFNEVFPKKYKAEKAFVIDSEGNISEQIDLVVYDTVFSPLIFTNNNIKYIPAESVYAVFEVKQEVNSTYIKYAANKIESVRKLVRTSAPINALAGNKPIKNPQPIIGGILCTKTSWKNANIKGNILRNLKAIVTSNINHINFICCLEKFSCEIKYGESIDFNCFEMNNILLFTYFTLLKLLQNMGNPPAIDYDKYCNLINKNK